MNNDDKVMKMFEIRKEECPHLKDKINERVIEYCTQPYSVYYQNLLEMFNERYNTD